MANVHFGNSGDVWKHLALAEVLASERPLHVWESHAGSAWYPLSHSPARDRGVYAFRTLAATSAALAHAPYTEILRELEPGHHLARYPGSPYLAMRIRQHPPAHFVFCDTDEESLADIKDVATRLSIDDSRLRLVPDDGLSTLTRLGAAWPAAEAAVTFVHIDPYDPLQESSPGLNALDLLCQLSDRGMRCFLWAGYDNRARRDGLFQALDRAMTKADTSPENLALWCGDMDFAGTMTAGRATNPEVISCLVIGSHLSEQSRAACDERGHELARRWGSTRRADGRDEAITYASFLVTDEA